MSLNEFVEVINEKGFVQKILKTLAEDKNYMRKQGLNIYEPIQTDDLPEINASSEEAANETETKTTNKAGNEQQVDLLEDDPNNTEEVINDNTEENAETVQEEKEETQDEQTTVAEEAPKPKRRGRPKGSKNKPKIETQNS
jgi:hypothetical protein